MVKLIHHPQKLHQKFPNRLCAIMSIASYFHYQNIATLLYMFCLCLTLGTCQSENNV